MPARFPGSSTGRRRSMDGNWHATRVQARLEWRHGMSMSRGNADLRVLSRFGPSRARHRWMAVAAGGRGGRGADGQVDPQPVPSTCSNRGMDDTQTTSAATSLPRCPHVTTTASACIYFLIFVPPPSRACAATSSSATTARVSFPSLRSLAWGHSRQNENTGVNLDHRRPERPRRPRLLNRSPRPPVRSRDGDVGRRYLNLNRVPSRGKRDRRG